MISVSPRRNRGRAASLSTPAASSTHPGHRATEQSEDHRGSRFWRTLFGEEALLQRLVQLKHHAFQVYNCICYVVQALKPPCHVHSRCLLPSYASRAIVGQAIATGCVLRGGDEMVEAETDASRPSRARKLTALGEEMATKAAARGR